MKPVKINVTADDIRLGQRAKNRAIRENSCPVARACVRQLKRKDVFVDGDTIRVGTDQATTPVLVRRAIYRFDDWLDEISDIKNGFLKGHKVRLPKPFTFLLRLEEY